MLGMLHMWSQGVENNKHHIGLESLEGCSIGDRERLVVSYKLACHVEI